MSHGHGDMDMPMTPNDDSMDMTFYWGKNAIVLFSGWPKDNTGMYVLALLFVFFMAFAVESLSSFTAKSTKLGMFVKACVHAVRMGLAYLVMLALMSFNGGIFIAAIFGHFLGFFFVKARLLHSLGNIGGHQNHGV